MVDFRSRRPPAVLDSAVTLNGLLMRQCSDATGSLFRAVPRCFNPMHSQKADLTAIRLKNMQRGGLMRGDAMIGGHKNVTVSIDYEYVCKRQLHICSLGPLTLY
jgi:hypothetical protein